MAVKVADNRKQEEKRKVFRIKVGHSGDLSGLLVMDGKQFKCEIIDYHFLGVKLNLAGSKFSESDIIKLEKFIMMYGAREIAVVNRPIVVRHETNKNMVLSFKPRIDERGLRTKVRLSVKNSFKPMILVKDPIRLETVLNFEIVNFNSTGFLLSTSLSNKHLLAGMEFNNAQLLLPGVRIIVVGFSIVHTQVVEDNIHMGARITSIDDDGMESLAQFAIFGTLPPARDDIDSKFNIVKENVTSIRRLASSIRCEVVSSPMDYSDVLKVRFTAYRKAGKIQEDLTVEHMADEYDERSIILLAKIDGAVVGTVRLVTVELTTQKFPFEEYFSFDKILKDYARAEIYEVSRLAIDPRFQGTDILVRLFKEVARYTLMNGKTTVCLATRALRKIYLRIGFKVISEEVAHPTVKNEKLALLKVDSERFMNGKDMSATAWHRVAEDVVDNIEFSKVRKVSSNTIQLKIKLQLERLILRFTKKKKSY